MIAVVGLTAAVVVLALDGGPDAGGVPAAQVSVRRVRGGPDHGGTEESAVAKALGAQATSGGPDESVVAHAIAGP